MLRRVEWRSRPGRKVSSGAKLSDSIWLSSDQCPHSGIANSECGQSFINKTLALSQNPFILSPFPCGTPWHGDWLSNG
jgi:hypothetical protein